jgi:hypothetical protein
VNKRPPESRTTAAPAGRAAWPWAPEEGGSAAAVGRPHRLVALAAHDQRRAGHGVGIDGHAPLAVLTGHGGLGAEASERDGDLLRIEVGHGRLRERGPIRDAVHLRAEDAG